MLRASGLILSVLVLGILAGCGSDTAPAPEAAPAAAASENKAGPDVAVFEFLKAVQTGDDKKAAEMLTKLAREKTAEMEMVVAPPGSETASFEVGEVQMLEDRGAYVSSTWTDVGEDGQPHSDQIVWLVRNEPEGWRIAGMVTKLFESKLVLNFEDPQDMMRKQQLAEQEMLRRAQQQVQGDAAAVQQPADNNAQAKQPQEGTLR
jgi:hypothetical protein